MKKSLSDARQELHSISLECSRLKVLYSKLGEYLTSGFHRAILFVGTILLRDIRKTCPT